MMKIIVNSIDSYIPFPSAITVFSVFSVEIPSITGSVISVDTEVIKVGTDSITFRTIYAKRLISGTYYFSSNLYLKLCFVPELFYSVILLTLSLIYVPYFEIATVFIDICKKYLV